MTQPPFEQDGECYLSLEVVAELYHVDGIVLREVFDRGLLGDGLIRGATLCIASVRLDVVATVVRLHQSFGFDVDAIEDWLPRSSRV
jgi:hypothetical protein